jgi:hypothetical protein
MTGTVFFVSQENSLAKILLINADRAAVTAEIVKKEMYLTISSF